MKEQISRELEDYHNVNSISIISHRNNNTGENPSLVHNIWEFQHDSDSKFIQNFIQEKRRSCKDLIASIPSEWLSIIKGDHCKDGNVNHHHSELQKNVNPNKQRTSYNQSQYGLVEKKESLLKNNKYPQQIPIFSQVNSSKNHRRKSILNQQKGNGKKQGKKQFLQKYLNQSPLQLNVPDVNHSGNILQILKNVQISQKFIDEQNLTPNRQITILARKHISNINLIIRQTKQLLFFNKLAHLNAEIEEARKHSMKLQINCRKLKIGLRNSSSCAGMLVDLRRKQYIGRTSSKNRIQENCSKNFCSTRQLRTKKPTLKINVEKQRILAEAIAKEKKKYIQLSARQARISNYYNYLRNNASQLTFIMNALLEKDQCKEYYESELSIDKKKYKANNAELNKQNFLPNKKLSEFSTSLSSAISLKTYKDILLAKKQIVKHSIQQTNTHQQRRVQIINEEVELLRKEISIIVSKLRKKSKNLITGNHQQNHFVGNLTETASFNQIQLKQSNNIRTKLQLKKQIKKKNQGNQNPPSNRFSCDLYQKNYINPKQSKIFRNKRLTYLKTKRQTEQLSSSSSISIFKRKRLFKSSSKISISKSPRSDKEQYKKNNQSKQPILQRKQYYGIDMKNEDNLSICSHQKLSEISLKNIKGNQLCSIQQFLNFEHQLKMQSISKKKDFLSDDFLQEIKQNECEKRYGSMSQSFENQDQGNYQNNFQIMSKNH